MHLFEYSQSGYGSRALSETESRTLVKDFLLAKRNGTENINGTDTLELHWKPLPRSTLERYLKAINDFDK